MKDFLSDVENSKVLSEEEKTILIQWHLATSEASKSRIRIESLSKLHNEWYNNGKIDKLIVAATALNEELRKKSKQSLQKS